MGRGLSQQQKQILGLAATVTDVHGLGVERGEVYTGDRYSHLSGVVMKDCKIADGDHVHCVHHVWNIPIDETLEVAATRYCAVRQGCPTEIFRPAFTQSNPGCFDMNRPGVNAAKVAASKALGRLIARDLLRYRLCSSDYIRGYVITLAGYEIGKSFKPQIDEGVIREYCESKRFAFDGCKLSLE